MMVRFHYAALNCIVRITVIIADFQSADGCSIHLRCSKAQIAQTEEQESSKFSVGSSNLSLGTNINCGVEQW